MKKLVSIACALALAASLTACGSGSKNLTDTYIKVGASPSPHADILRQVQPILKEQGITLEIQEFDDYVMPNTALENGDLGANYFQHEPYLIDFNAQNDTHLVTAAYVHYEPLGVYPGKTASLDALPDGAKVGIPNDNTNGGRALLLLADLGLIELKDGLDLDYFRNAEGELDFSEYDGIASNPKNLEFVPMEAANLPPSLPDLDIAVINGNYALGAGIADQVIATETDDTAKVFANVLAVKEGTEDSKAVQALIEALRSDEIKAYIQETYQGTVVPVE